MPKNRTSTVLCFAVLLTAAASPAPAQEQPRAKQIESFLEKYHEHGLFNGAALVAEEGEVLYKGGFGEASRSWGIPNTPQTRFSIGSVTKQFTATLVLQLVEEGSEDREPSDVPDSAIVVRQAPQGELIRRARLVLHHAGMNTTLDAMAAGVPMVTVPLAFEQPGIAVRASRLGIARRLSLRRLSADRLREAIAEVLSDPAYERRARELSRRMDPEASKQYAARVAERALETGQPVPRHALDTPVEGIHA